MQFVIFHGSLGSKGGNWFPDLKSKLEEMGQEVICPQYPVDRIENIKKSSSYKTVQNLDAWFKTFSKEVLPKLKKGKKISFVGHSLGNLFILHCLEKYKIKLDSAIFVSPCLDSLGLVPWQYDKVNQTFYKTDFDYDELVKLAPVSYVLYSDTDPYIEPRRAKHFAKVMESSHILVRNAGHMNSEVNLNEFPLVFDLCVTRLDLDLHQKFVYLRSQNQAVSNIKNPDQKVIKLTIDEVYDEGRFHFMNLTKSGFATYPTDTGECDPYAEYYMMGRRVAKSGIPFTRIYYVIKKSDLKRKPLLKQIELDINAGIDVRIMDRSELSKIAKEEDFGVWDEIYVCTITRDKRGNPLYSTLDARTETIKRAIREARKLKKASRKLSSPRELENFRTR